MLQLYWSSTKHLYNVSVMKNPACHKLTMALQVANMAEAMIEALAEQLVQVLKKPGEYVIEFQSEFNDMKTQLDLMKSFLADAYKLKRKKETVKTTLIISMLRELVYDVEDILTDCLLRAEYRKEGFQCCSNFTPREMIFQYRTGKKLKDINERIKKMQKILKAYFKTIGQQSIHDDRGSIGKRWTSPVYDESAIVGLIEDTEKIIGWILPENRMLHQVGIVGMGGLRKTTVSQKIFDSKQVVDRFEKRIWVSISQTVNEEEIMKTVLKQLGEDVNGLDMAQMLPKIKQLLENKNYLIVMDDVWSAEGWWDRIRKLRIVLQIAFSSNEEAKQHPELEEVGKVIVKKCHGLPLAAKTIGGLLKSKAQSTEVWRRICHNFDDALTAKESENSVMASLQLSYDELPIRMKQCLLCFFLYPEDSEIATEHATSSLGIGRLSNLQELSGFKLVGADNKDGCRLAELQNLLQLRVLRVNIINISEESEIVEEELTVLTHLKQLKVLSINSEGCDKEEIFQNLERLSPPPHLEELYLRHYRGGLTPQWINPTSPCHLQYLCMENGDIKSTSPVFEGTNGTTWKVVGLCLKFLPRLHMEWEMVQRVMPRIRYVEVSHCYMLKSFPCNIDKLGVWRK
eukprot:XP_024467399.1 disease resistance RPP13-like protein 4 [Populus trichocarpa]